MKMLRVWSVTIMLIAILLPLFGVLTIAYAGTVQSGNLMQHFAMQLGYLGIALVGAMMLYLMDYRFYLKPEILWTLAGLTIFPLVLVQVPGIGKEVKGSLRWIRLGPLSVQPVEFAKLMIVMFLAAYYETIGGRVARWKHGIFIPGGVLAIVAGLLLLQPDFGGTMIVCFLAGITMLLAGVGFKRCLLMALCAAIVIVGLIAMNPNRVKRLTKDVPWIARLVEANNVEYDASGNVVAKSAEVKTEKKKNYQADHSKIAFKNGGLWGVGLGNGMQKEYYLPECHTDFIFAVIGEDFGFVATASIWLAFLLLLFGGSAIAFRAKDKQGMLLAFGATLLICVQGVSNMAVTTNVFPTKGLALPFISYGGSCLLSSFFSIGVLLSVARKTIELEENEDGAFSKKVVSFD